MELCCHPRALPSLPRPRASLPSLSSSKTLSPLSNTCRARHCPRASDSDETSTVLSQKFKEPPAPKKAEETPAEAFSVEEGPDGGEQSEFGDFLNKLDVKMELKGERTDKMSVYLKTQNQDDVDVQEIIMQYNELLNEVPEEHQTIEDRDHIFHEVLGKDGHGYCRTYGSAVSRSMVYKKDSGPSQCIGDCSSNIEEITRQVTKAMREEFSTQMEQLRAQIDLLVSKHG